MTSTIVSMTLALAMSSTGGLFSRGGGYIMPPGPGYGWGFPNGNPDNYGWNDYGWHLPIGINADRTSEWYFQRQFSVPVNQMFLPTYYNAYLTRGQRYIPYTNCGGWHPAGGPPMGSAEMPVHPYNDTIGSGPQVRVPAFSGRVEAPPVNSGGSGLTP